MLFFGAVGALAPVDGVLVWAWQRAGLLVTVLLLGAAGRSGANLILHLLVALGSTAPAHSSVHPVLAYMSPTRTGPGCCGKHDRMDGGGLCFSFIDWSAAKKTAPTRRANRRELDVDLIHVRPLIFLPSDHRTFHVYICQPNT